ncbi:MAG: glycosyltransferase family 9 protein [Tannerella sp.]|nr:glycosyltransferase family 9 protein [Tannerella sp.]
MSKALIIRFSAIGDVAMTIPVIYSVAKANPADTFTVLTQAFLAPLFVNRPPNVSILEMDKNTKRNLFFTYLRYVLALRKHKFDIVLDLHMVIRTWLIDVLFAIYGKRVFKLEKGRKEKKRLTARPPKIIFPLPSMTARYEDVFRRAGFRTEQTFVSLYDTLLPDVQKTEDIAGKKEGFWIGIAPFAKHRGKIYPIEQMEKVVKALTEQQPVKIFLFGAHGEEEAVFSRWETICPNIKNMAGKCTLDKELILMSQLDLLVSMDSANMHFASLVGTPVISIWGATHPFAGFYGYHQNPGLIIQKNLSCRPCSIFGNKPCYRGDWACMEMDSGIIVEKVKKFFSIQ